MAAITKARAQKLPRKGAPPDFAGLDNAAAIAARLPMATNWKYDAPVPGKAWLRETPVETVPREKDDPLVIYKGPYVPGGQK
ncbi:MAG: hypothetical protein HXY22_11530 [Alphaproteobacteria bacterium]|nr:hypothetical protein [Alphaproteobacteria bacterium]